jgi:transcription elongation factor GreA
MAPPSVTRADFDALVGELDSLRSRHRDELARQLRDARACGSPADDDDVMAVLGEVSVDLDRISRLEELVRTAVVVDTAFDGSAALGCAVRAVNESGRVIEFLLVGRRSSEAARHEVSPASPIGKALLGARPGTVVQVELPGGGSRLLEILEVLPPRVASEGSPPEGGRKAA